MSTVPYFSLSIIFWNTSKWVLFSVGKTTLDWWKTWLISIICLDHFTFNLSRTHWRTASGWCELHSGEIKSTETETESFTAFSWLFLVFIYYLLLLCNWYLPLHLASKFNSKSIFLISYLIHNAQQNYVTCLVWHTMVHTCNFYYCTVRANQM